MPSAWVYKLLFALVIALPVRAKASDISLQLNVSSTDNRVTVTVANTGRDTAEYPELTIELNGVQQKQLLGPRLPAGERRTRTFVVDLPKDEGSYPLLTMASYLNGGQKLSVLDVGYFNFRRTSELEAGCISGPIRLGKETDLFIPHDPKLDLRLFLPLEVPAQRVSSTKYGSHFVLQNSTVDFNSNYAVFAVLESPKSWPVHSTKICSLRLLTSATYIRTSFFSSEVIILLGIAGLAAAWLLCRKAPINRLTRFQLAAARSAFSIFIVSLLYLAYRHLHLVTELVQPILAQTAPQNPVLRYLSSSAQLLLQTLYFEGTNYDYFFRYVADYLYIYMLLVNPFVLYFVIRPEAENDKYFHLLRTFFSLPGLRRVLRTPFDNSFYWTKQSRLALLSLTVKTFYIPLLCSWTINQALHCSLLVTNLTLKFASVNRAAVETLIFIDVVIFTVGYLSELPQMKNRIRSVEPTLLGWAVCLMCYPPFNLFSFRPFDYPLNSSWTAAHGWSAHAAQFVISLLWAIYVWASIALGFKASNLTNRGIVESGPYRFVRHPAYAAKVSLWIVSSFFLGDKNFFLILALIVVYSLRGWTEERHLSQDPDYLAYRQRVKWKIFPYVL